jgi:hypothetical protein
VWVSAEWLYWVASGQSAPPLATSSPAGTAQALAGVLGAPGTQVLFPTGRLNNDWRNGLRVNAGVWLDECQTLGLEGDFFFLQPSRQGYSAGSDGSRIISRPFFNALGTASGAPAVRFAGAPPGTASDAELVSYPNVLAGTVTVDSRSRFIGGGVNLVRNLYCDPCGRLDLLVGYRTLNLRDDLTIREDLTGLAGSEFPGARFQIEDRFRTNNAFHGGVLGLGYEKRWSSWYVGVRSSVALGVTRTETTISGQTTITPPGITYAGGLLTQPTNIGRYTSNHFAVVPEVGVRLGAQVTERMRAFVGYNFLYWSNVARAGEQIDLRVNPNQIAPPQPLNGPALPAFTPRRSDYWVQGISLGLELRF